jgi:two-component system, cell cycle response regulator DivK
MLDWDTITTWSVLLIDDEPDNLEVVAESLEFYGLTVRTAGNGKSALEILKDFTPTLILLDLSMPIMDGWETRMRIKSNPHTQHLPIVALSAHAMAGDKERALAAGFDGYLTKPINVPTLMDDIRAALGGRPDAKPVPATNPHKETEQCA